LITDGDDGVLVQPSDPDALAKALHDLAADPERCDRLGRQGRCTYLRRFTPEANLAQLEEIYRDAIRRRS
jgi:glycosyltransferase involved in cell wall biosynthesis